jgi:hypothetical protein
VLRVPFSVQMSVYIGSGSTATVLTDSDAKRVVKRYHNTAGAPSAASVANERQWLVQISVGSANGWSAPTSRLRSAATRSAYRR